MPVRRAYRALSMAFGKRTCHGRMREVDLPHLFEALAVNVLLAANIERAARIVAY